MEKEGEEEKPAGTKKDILDAFSHLYKRVCPSVCRSVRRSVRPSVRPSVRQSVRNHFAPLHFFGVLS